MVSALFKFAAGIHEVMNIGMPVPHGEILVYHTLFGGRQRSGHMGVNYGVPGEHFGDLFAVA